jgi:hypothetical protein
MPYNWNDMGPERKEYHRRQKKNRKLKSSELHKKRMSTQVNFETTELPDTTDLFYRFEQYPETATMLYHFNSGSNLFPDLDWLGEGGHSDEEIENAIVNAHGRSG